MNQIRSLFDIFAPIHSLWWAIFGQPVDWMLVHIYNSFVQFPLMAWIGAYGLAIIALTILIKTLLSPIYQWQLMLGKRNMENQRRVAPQLAEARKKYKGDPQKMQAATMEVYREHGVNPLGSLSGCLPSLIQMPILIALYWVFYGNARSHPPFPTQAHFLFIPNLNLSPITQPLIHGLPIPAISYLIIPVLAALSTFIQSRMMQQPPNPAASDQEQQAQAVTKQMQVFMPLMIGVFAISTPAGLGLYWFISNCFAIIQQYLVNGWGGLRPQAAIGSGAAPPPAPGSKPAGSSRPAPPPKPVAPPKAIRPQKPPPGPGRSGHVRPTTRATNPRRPRKPKR